MRKQQLAYTPICRAFCLALCWRRCYYITGHVILEINTDRTTLIPERIDVMVGSPSKKSRWTWNICGFLENCWWQTWFSPIQHEQSSSQHYEFNQKTLILKCKFVIGTRMNTLRGAGKARFNVATPTNATVTCTAYVLPYNFQTKSI